MQDELKEVLDFATEAHKGQVRKYTGEPYITHPISVSKQVKKVLTFYGYEDETILLAMKCALLHDVVEDTDVSIEDVEEHFGVEVAQGVWFLTDPDFLVGNRELRKRLTRDRLSLAPDYIKQVKRCDIEDNEPSIKEHDPKFYKVFKKEIRLLLEVL